jgi:hypothetical protein
MLSEMGAISAPVHGKACASLATVVAAALARPSVSEHVEWARAKFARPSTRCTPPRKIVSQRPGVRAKQTGVVGVGATKPQEEEIHASRG